MHPLTLEATFGGLLHDLGKPIFRSGRGGNHSDLGQKLLQQVWPQAKEIARCAGFHHGKALRNSPLPSDSPAYIVYLADNLSAAADRRAIEGEDSGFDRYLPLQPVFSHLNGEHPGFSLPPVFQDGSLRMPVKGSAPATAGEYAALTEKLRSGLLSISPEKPWLNSALGLLESTLSYVPSSTSLGESPDISLYDHSKVTGAIAACISEYLLQQQERDFHRCLFQHEEDFRKKQVFLLYSADFSGIQKFIFTVATKGALASLRSRSFFLELLMEHYIDELLEACSLSRANLLYSGGGHCFLLLPNIPQSLSAVKQWNQKFNTWLLTEFGAQLFIAHGWIPCSGNDLTNTPAQDVPYTAIFRQVSSAITRHKLSRYSPEQVRLLNQTETHTTGRECIVCGNTTPLDGQDRCKWCSLFVQLSPKILKYPIYLVSKSSRDMDFCLPGLNADAYFMLTDEKNARSRLKSDNGVIRVYSKNQFYTGLAYATRLYVGDYCASNSMESLSADSTGIQRLGVCRMDVDNLGHAFTAGFRRTDVSTPEEREHFLTLSRTAAFSRQMSLFFKCYINSILRTPRSDSTSLSVAIVYSGGDDVFLVGAWDSILEAVSRIQESFSQFSCGSLTVSAGISLHHAHFPIRQAAEHSAALETLAKSQPMKNSIALFDAQASHVYDWNTFRKNVLAEKLSVLKQFFESEGQERGNAFLYQVLELLRGCSGAPINIARYAYLLARMEPKEYTRKAVYQTFSRSMYRWGLSAQSRQELITAIYLFVYMGRKES